MMSLKDSYKTSVVPELMKEFGYKNVNAVPVVNTVTLNIGVGPGMKDAKFLETTQNTLKRITGQRPVSTKARKSIAGFKIREGSVVGVMVTLRGKRMWDFLEKLINVSLPRVRDFRGLSPKSFDGNGNYSIGFKEHMAFPEISSEEIEITHGIQVTIATSAKTDKEAEALLKHLRLPLKQDA
ncbi:MAG: 50S ribosomal protein L5 [Candidatus Uhrbacteria bacterium]|nr:50S ribosomal protein L5 [Candidatus Uhrbacteria bacterium]